ncbi:hypothetical protein G647_05282 [Cladophialophora carrionii CBS 160.54]|uniref:Uncharacterized protein n=1 Tax=Cladophialophora carrionii CBS 160.54 TaxID=1279043 RepID=V9D9H1_9EURO|nr:uncharacterized protein G647_05282 [Cladophialophora carrionii CBS 160.54]ETI23480.1 hypothetical protein G647_05282 [Cladophialophora carrionii CBS 160.54]
MREASTATCWVLTARVETYRRDSSSPTASLGSPLSLKESIMKRSPSISCLRPASAPLLRDCGRKASGGHTRIASSVVVSRAWLTGCCRWRRERSVVKS